MKLKNTLLGLIIGCLIVLEILLARLAFHTLGEIMSFNYFFLVFLNIIPLIYLLCKKRTGFAYTFLVVIALIIIPYQLYLGGKLILLNEEGGNIIAHLYQEKLETGQYPASLSGYQFSYPHLQNDFGYELENENFNLFYSVGDKGTSHYFRSINGKWGYYPD